MKKKRTLVLSIACGVLCAGCVFLYSYGLKSEAEQARAEALEQYGGQQTQACVATRTIAPGEVIDERSVERKLWIADLLPEGAVTDLDAAVGQKATSSILEGEVISSKRFGQEAALLDVPEGLVAVSVPAKDVQAIGGAVVPGMRVHLYATGNTSTSRVGSDVLVLATSQSASGSEESAGQVTWVTVAVDPEDVQELVSVANKEQLYFALPGAAEDAAQANLADQDGTASAGVQDSGQEQEAENDATGREQANE